ncbi:DUF1003 domain-containing protein [uncultured Hyphomicrobium sp.]|uniref:DUF1003 domain-containing protein n=1 Tax=uncultured Hyphomicrobium sp. TaxID=194373 RepID=UPI0025F24F35|nr:DUF1003 domain-containing protein [uncultured Hyphomicrobium sp.]
MSNHANAANAKSTCAVSGRELPRRLLVNLETVRPNLAERIRREHPDLPADALIAKSELERYRSLYVEELLRDETGEISELEQRVADSLATHETLSENVEEHFEEKRTFGEMVSDHLASFGGSWVFILSFLALLCVWMAYNVARGTGSAFDPYPFILLNLVLSCLAALQAPIIMMSQKRQEAKDRLRSLNDYQVNLKAELEIRHLHEKLDHLINKQWQRLAEIQQLQLEIMQDRRG